MIKMGEDAHQEEATRISQDWTKCSVSTFHGGDYSSTPVQTVYKFNRL